MFGFDMYPGIPLLQEQNSCNIFYLPEHDHNTEGSANLVRVYRGVSFQRAVSFHHARSSLAAFFCCIGNTIFTLRPELEVSQRCAPLLLVEQKVNSFSVVDDDVW